MPQIQIYESQVAAPGPSPGRGATPSDFGADIGGALQQLGQAGGRVAQSLKENEDRAEVSDLRAKMATARSIWTVHLRERADAAVPGDRTFAFKFSEDLAKYLAPFGESARTEVGRRAFKEMSAGLEGDMYERASVHQAQLAGIKAKQDFTVALDATRNTLLNDPTQFERALNDATLMARSNTNLPTMVRQELEVSAKKQLALSALQGIIKLDGTTARETINSGKWDKYLDADNKTVLMAMANERINAERIEREHAAAEAERALKQERAGTMNEYFTSFTEHKLTVADVADDDKITFEQKHTLYNMLEAQAREAREPVKTSPGAFSAMLNKIRRGKVSDELDIERRFTQNRDVSWDDVLKLRKEYEDMLTPEGKRLGEKKDDFIRAVSPRIDKSNLLMGFIDQTGREQVYLMQSYMEDRIQEKRDQNKDIFVLFDPAHPEYLGRSVHLFQKTLEESANALPRAITIAPATKAVPTGKPAPDNKKRLPGETIQQWNDCTRGVK